MSNKVTTNLNSVFEVDNLNSDIIDYSLPINYKPPVPNYSAKPATIEPTKTTELDDDVILPDADITPYVDKRTLKKDFNQSRKMIKKLLDIGEQNIRDLEIIARESEQGRNFEVLATLMKTVLDINNSSLDLHKKYKEILEPKRGSSSQLEINNNGGTTQVLAIGNALDIQKMLRGDPVDNNESIIEDSSEE